jgi:2-methylcitrate dehydratase PrpD
MDRTAITRDLARFATELSFERIPSRVIEKTKLQILSVLGASFAGARSGVCNKILAAAREWSSGADGDVSLIGNNDRLPLHHALYANSSFSIVHDFDDYLFAGHTGHSAVLTSLAWAEKLGRSGREMLAAAVVANEVGGRLGAAFLLGPQNGQMWSYIHLLEAVCVSGRFLGLDTDAIAHAIGIAFTQPPYPLLPAFFGPDSKATLAATPTVAGVQAAELAANGVTGAREILGGPDGFIARVAQRPLWLVFSGYGSAWLTDSLCFKVVPGCAYIDTAVDALDEIETERGQRFAADEIDNIRCESNYLTAGMEMLSIRYGGRAKLSPITVNFSVALSLAVKVLFGALDTQFLEHDFLTSNRDRIVSLADKIKVENDAAMTARMSGLDSVGIDLRRYLGGEGDASKGHEPTLDGVSFEKYRMAFPVRLVVRTHDGKEFAKVAETPTGGAGRPFDETRARVREKFLSHATPSISTNRAQAALQIIEELESAGDIRALAEQLRP